ncbi:hypothetical protein D3C85_1777100 [compost metagenome]
MARNLSDDKSSIIRIKRLYEMDLISLGNHGSVPLHELFILFTNIGGILINITINHFH